MNRQKSKPTYKKQAGNKTRQAEIRKDKTNKLYRILKLKHRFLTKTKVINIMIH